jgi:hypothetical protein
MGGGGGRGELTRHYEDGSVSSRGFESRHVIPPNHDETTGAIDAVIEEHVQRLDPPARQLRELGDLKRAIQASLSRELAVDATNVVGSVAKGTQIDRPEGNDIDVEFVLNPISHGDWLTQDNGPRNCLTNVRSILSSDPQFSHIELRVDRNTVTARIGQSRVDIIPAFRHPDGGVLIPDTTGSLGWVRTNPRMSKRILQEKDRRWGGQVSQTLKIAKEWSMKNGGHLTSTHIEAMVEAHFDRKSQNGENSSRANVHEFFARLPWYVQRSSYEPVYGQRVDTYLSSEDRSRVIARASRVGTRVNRAERAAQGADNSDAAAEAYRELLDG